MRYFLCIFRFCGIRNGDRVKTRMQGFSFIRRIWKSLILNELVHILQIANYTAFFPKARMR